MHAITQVETLAAKHAWECIAATYGCQIKCYHADNGRYAEADFKADAESLGQQVTYCDVVVHHQNGLAKNTVKQFTLKGHTLLLHAKRHWPEAITTILWPFALKEQELKLITILNLIMTARPQYKSFRLATLVVTSSMPLFEIDILGDVRFLYCMQGNLVWLVHPSGNRVHVWAFTLVIHLFTLGQSL
eukprot:scaffold84697_cov32-Attheya_sp.AAC.2